MQLSLKTVFVINLNTPITFCTDISFSFCFTLVQSSHLLWPLWPMSGRKWVLASTETSAKSSHCPRPFHRTPTLTFRLLSQSTICNWLISNRYLFFFFCWVNHFKFFVNFLNLLLVVETDLFKSTPTGLHRHLLAR
jgi:hypothetical protein